MYYSNYLFIYQFWQVTSVKFASEYDAHYSIPIYKALAVFQ